MDKGRKKNVAFWVLIQALQEHEKPQEPHQYTASQQQLMYSKEGKRVIDKYCH